MCDNQKLARLAVLYESDMNKDLFSSLFKNEYWIDLFMDSSFSMFFHSRMYQSNSTFNNTFWEGANQNDEQCVSYKTNTMNFKSQKCKDNKEVLCEIIL